ncbi:FKBP-type peptidyl-prolyl cis-trans isomerase [Crossiella cryophila]|uniref:Peptidyl-prolyl cis-trans isomerase n=1 Tax=Crossiella cryophila TaxID=43355 RepID=A0A7W7CAS0_9PSEU|nr:FKBP-type peptidyl-prolyl cis-trans isomerase [Crossiella cryophila]MBB4677699.1 peptidylprolyl isomerase [Crossiella cryophila]
MSLSLTISRARLLAAGAVTALGLLVAGCTPSEAPAGLEELAKANTTPSAAAASSSAATSAAGKPAGAPCTIDAFKVEGAANAKPTVTVPTDCSAPTTLLSKDITPGTGAGLKSGETVEAHYHLTTFSDRAFKQSSYDGGKTFTAPIGVGQVVKGWDQGLIGQKAGSRRLLVVPAELGYGAAGKGDIAPNETLIFVVDLVKITPGAGS